MAEPRAGTAYADLPGGRAAAAAAARLAWDRAGGDEPSLVICFHHGRHSPDDVRSGVEDVFGAGVPIAGGSAMGVITNDALGYEGHQVGVAVLTGAGSSIRVLADGGLREAGEHATGRAIGEGLAEEDVLLLYSSVRTGLSDAGMELFFGTPLLHGLRETATALRTLAGAGLIDALGPMSSHVLTPAGTLRDGAVALAFQDGLRMDCTVMHGCLPAGAYHEITATEGPLVLEIDGRPALDVVDELMGGSGDYSAFPFRVILGVNHGERFGAFDPDSYQTRLCLAVLPERRAIVMFEPDLQPGATVQLMRTSHDFAYIPNQVAQLLERLDGRRPVLALYADCAGRCMAASPLDAEEGDFVREALGDIPLLGFYTGVEIGPVGGDVRPLDQSGVLCILSA